MFHAVTHGAVPAPIALLRDIESRSKPIRALDELVSQA
jgi:hypothetical protein